MSFACCANIGCQENAMDTMHGLRIEGLSGQGRGHNPEPTLPRRRRAHWLINLVDALERGDLDMARLQFTGLVHDDPDMSHHPLLHRIGNALQSSNIRMAQQLAHELRDEGLSAWNDSMHARASIATGTGMSGSAHRASSGTPSAINSPGHRASNSEHIIDLRA
jgi:hypothetical protein